MSRTQSTATSAALALIGTLHEGKPHTVLTAAKLMGVSRHTLAKAYARKRKREQP